MFVRTLALFENTVAFLTRTQSPRLPGTKNDIISMMAPSHSFFMLVRELTLHLRERMSMRNCPDHFVCFFFISFFAIQHKQDINVNTFNEFLSFVSGSSAITKDLQRRDVLFFRQSMQLKRNKLDANDTEDEVTKITIATMNKGRISCASAHMNRSSFPHTLL